jgi:hypothetical protein
MCLRFAILTAAILCGGWIAPAQSSPAEEAREILAGKAAMGDWTSDAPGVRRKITVNDLPPPGSNALAMNPPRVVRRPEGAQLQVPPGFKIEMFASGFRDQRRHFRYGKSRRPNQGFAR